MSTRATNPLFAALLDDAALFPPGNLALSTAVPAHLAAQAGPRGELIGRFLCPASRVGELQSTLRGDERLTLGLILDTDMVELHEAVSRVYEDARLDLTSVEMPISPDADQAAAAHDALKELARLPDSVAGFVELPPVRGWRDALSLVAARRRGAKLRTGGIMAEAFPSERVVAEFIRACVSGGASFKCTAGLHHAVGYRDDRTGFAHHGFLNILLATHAATRGASASELEGILSERDPGDLVEMCINVDEADAVAARRHFVSFGCCGVDEPIDDLTGLGLIDKQAAA